jgi:acyl carrier protein
LAQVSGATNMHLDGPEHVHLKDGFHRTSRWGIVLIRHDSSESDIRAWCIEYLTGKLKLPASRIDPDTKFARLGMDSATSVFLVMDLEEWLGVELDTNLVFEHPSVTALARYVANQLAEDGLVAGQRG